MEQSCSNAAQVGIGLRLRRMFGVCAKCAGEGAGGALAAHTGCIVLPTAVGAFGAAASSATMTALMYVASPLVAIGAAYGIDRWRGRKASVPKLLGSAAVALGMTFGMSSLGHHDHSLSEAQAWIDTLPPETRRGIVDNARALNLTPAEYARQICLENPAIREAMEKRVKPEGPK